MQGTGNQPPAMLPARAVFQAGDIERNTELYNVTMLPTPTNFFSEVARKVINCQRVLAAAQLHNQTKNEIDMISLISAFSDAMHAESAYRTEDNDLKIDEALLRACCEKSGLSKDLTDKLLKDSQGPEAKNALKQNTEEAMEIGAYGSPTFVIYPDGKDSFMTFGSDRFEQIAHVCGKPYYGVNLQAKSSL